MGAEARLVSASHHHVTAWTGGRLRDAAFQPPAATFSMKPI